MFKWNCVIHLKGLKNKRKRLKWFRNIINDQSRAWAECEEICSKVATLPKNNQNCTWQNDIVMESIENYMISNSVKGYSDLL